MELSLQEIVFYVVGAGILFCSVMAVTAGKILHSATYLLFVLFGTGVIYGLLGYNYLSAVQLMVYADRNMKYHISRSKLFCVLLTTIAGAALVLFLIVTNGFVVNTIPQGVEIPTKEIGHALVGTGKYQFVLPFEVIGVLLLSCMIGAIMIARKDKKQTKEK